MASTRRRKPWPAWSATAGQLGSFGTKSSDLVRLSAFALLSLALCCPPTASASSPRSPAIRAEFVKANPCPATGKTRGKCPGWEVDHIEPLKCNGPDTPANMQWLTVEQHRAKTKAEAKLCRRGRDGLRKAD
jgi:hypothetical protein